MDDFEVTNLHESKNEWVARLVNVLTPLVQQGVKSIFDESWKLCEENDEVECWGTGAPMREFMYVEDAAEAIVQTLEKYEDNDTPLNVGTGSDISIKELVTYIVDALQYEGGVFWNTEKPDGQMKKLLDTSRMQEILDISPIDVKEGIKQTVAWYIENKEEADARK